MSTPPSPRGPLKVLLVSPDYPPTLGGIQRLLHRITAAMPDSEVRVVTMRSEGCDAFDAASGQEIIRLPCWGKRASVRNAMFNIAAVLRRDGWRPDIVLNGHVVSAPAAVMLARRYGVALITYTYGKEVLGRPRTTAWAMRHSSAGIAVSQYTRDQVLEAMGVHSTTPVHVIHPGVEVPDSLERKASDRPTILTVARLRDWYKGHDVILEGLARVRAALPDVQWIVIGGGPLLSELQERAQQLGVDDAVRFLGAAADDEKEHWLARADVFVMPSRYPTNEVAGEGFPVVYLEAAGWALPAVAGNVGGPVEAVQHGVTGLLVDPEDPDEVAGALISLLENRAYARSLGDAARLRASTDFTWDVVGRRLRDTLDAARYA